MKLADGCNRVPVKLDGAEIGFLHLTPQQEARLRGLWPDHIGRCLVIDTDDALAEMGFVSLPVVYFAPLLGAGVMPCCGRTPFEAAEDARITIDRDAVTCRGGR